MRILLVALLCVVACRVLVGWLVGWLVGLQVLPLLLSLLLLLRRHPLPVLLLLLARCHHSSGECLSPVTTPFLQPPLSLSVLSLRASVVSAGVT
jgi:hypothetical protein